MTKITETDEAFLRRAKKLMALAHDGGATEAEAAAAAAKLQELLQDRNLTLAQVEGASLDGPETKREKRTADRRAMYEYQQNLMRTLADNNFCLHHLARVFVRDRGWGAVTRPLKDEAGQIVRDENGHAKIVTGHYEKRHLLVGRQLNVDVTIATYDYLLEALARANPYDHRSKDGKRFLDGGVSRLVERLVEKRRQREAEDEAKRSGRVPAGNGTHRELVLSDVYGSEADLNNDAYNGFPPGTTAANRRRAEELEMERKAVRERLVAEGVDPDVAWYRSYGYDDERAVQRVADDRRRSGRPGRGRARSWTRGDEAHYRKINSESYRAGRAAGGTIGLDDQVGAASRKRIGS